MIQEEVARHTPRRDIVYNTLAGTTMYLMVFLNVIIHGCQVGSRVVMALFALSMLQSVRKGRPQEK